MSSDKIIDLSNVDSILATVAMTDDELYQARARKQITTAEARQIEYDRSTKGASK